ncbi:Armadillo-type fold [Naviculisporaceae sp. PSN 640]
MSFAIEVPGEAAPLSPFELVKALEAASSSTNRTQRQSASEQLTSWETQPDYFPGLQSVFLDKSIPHAIRLLAIIQLKNGIDKYWRHTARYAIKPAQKELIRSRLLQGSVGEEDKTLALHNALVVAKIVRVDYPNDWPDALPTIISVTRSSRGASALHLNGALQVLLRVVKELGTARLRRSQTALQALTPDLIQLLGEIYMQTTGYWREFLMNGRGDEDDADYAMKNSLVTLKILRRLVTVGYENPHLDPMVQEFWSLSQTQLDQFLRGVSRDSWIPVPYQDLVGKRLIQFTKLHIDMSETHPSSFAVLPNSIPLVQDYWKLVREFSEVFERSDGIRQTGNETAGGSLRHEGPLLEKLALKGLLLLRSCVAIAYRPTQTFKYRSPEAKEQEKEAIRIIKEDLLTKDLLDDIVKLTMTRLFIFRKSDLEAWEDNPEEWESAERHEGGAYEWAIRPCAERLLVDLLTFYKELGEPLLAYCDLVAKVPMAMDIVTKEAAYCALGCAAAVLEGKFNFDQFLVSCLVKDSQLQDPMAKLLRRRISILISQWMPVKIAESSQPIVFQIFRHLLNPSDPHNDEVVRLTAARELKSIGECFEFNGEYFLVVAADVFGFLMNLLEEANSDEARTTVLEAIRVVVNRMEKHVSQFGDALMTTLPQLWEDCDADEWSIKQAILSIMSALVASMRADSQRYHGIIIPLLQQAVDSSTELHLNLIEESVELWKTVVLQSVPPLNRELVQLVQHALPLLEYDSTVAAECLELLNDYIILVPGDILSDELRQATLTALLGVLKLRSREQYQQGARCIGLLIRAAETLGGVQGLSVVVDDLLQTGVITYILESLHSVWESQETTGPNRKASKINTIQQTDYIAILARIALGDPGVFVRMLAGLDQSGNNSVQSIWSWLGTVWFSSFDNMADIDRQKLSCLALTRLLELPSPMQELSLSRMQDYLSMWTSVITELSSMGPDHNGATRPPPGNDQLVWTHKYEPSEWDVPKDLISYEQTAKDPVHTVHTFDFVNARLHDLVQRGGGEEVFQREWAANVDKEVIAGFQALTQPRAEE